MPNKSSHHDNQTLIKSVLKINKRKNVPETVNKYINTKNNQGFKNILRQCANGGTPKDLFTKDIKAMKQVLGGSSPSFKESPEVRKVFVSAFFLKDHLKALHECDDPRTFLANKDDPKARFLMAFFKGCLEYSDAVILSLAKVIKDLSEASFKGLSNWCDETAADDKKITYAYLLSPAGMTLKELNAAQAALSAPRNEDAAEGDDDKNSSVASDDTSVAAESDFDDDVPLIEEEEALKLAASKFAEDVSICTTKAKFSDLNTDSIPAEMALKPEDVAKIKGENQGTYKAKNPQNAFKKVVQVMKPIWNTETDQQKLELNCFRYIVRSVIPDRYEGYLEQARGELVKAEEDRSADKARRAKLELTGTAQEKMSQLRKQHPEVAAVLEKIFEEYPEIVVEKRTDCAFEVAAHTIKKVLEMGAPDSVDNAPQLFQMADPIRRKKTNAVNFLASSLPWCAGTYRTGLFLPDTSPAHIFLKTVLYYAASKGKKRDDGTRLAEVIDALQEEFAPRLSYRMATLLGQLAVSCVVMFEASRDDVGVTQHQDGRMLNTLSRLFVRESLSTPEGYQNVRENFAAHALLRLALFFASASAHILIPEQANPDDYDAQDQDNVRKLVTRLGTRGVALDNHFQCIFIAPELYLKDAGDSSAPGQASTVSTNLTVISSWSHLPSMWTEASLWKHNAGWYQVDAFRRSVAEVFQKSRDLRTEARNGALAVQAPLVIGDVQEDAAVTSSSPKTESKKASKKKAQKAGSATPATTARPAATPTTTVRPGILGDAPSPTSANNAVARALGLGKGHTNAPTCDYHNPNGSTNVKSLTSHTTEDCHYHRKDVWKIFDDSTGQWAYDLKKMKCSAEAARARAAAVEAEVKSKGTSSKFSGRRREREN